MSTGEAAASDRETQQDAITSLGFTMAQAGQIDLVEAVNLFIAGLRSGATVEETAWADGA